MAGEPLGIGRRGPRRPLRAIRRVSGVNAPIAHGVPGLVIKAGPYRRPVPVGQLVGEFGNRVDTPRVIAADHVNQRLQGVLGTELRRPAHRPVTVLAVEDQCLVVAVGDGALLGLPSSPGVVHLRDVHGEVQHPLQCLAGVAVGHPDLLAPVHAHLGAFHQRHHLGCNTTLQRRTETFRTDPPLRAIRHQDLHRPSAGLAGLLAKYRPAPPTIGVVAQIVEDGDQIDVALRGLLAAGHRPVQQHAARPRGGQHLRRPPGVRNSGHRRTYPRDGHIAHATNTTGVPPPTSEPPGRGVGSGV